MSAAAADMSDVRGHALPIMSGAALGRDWMGSRQGAAASLWDLSPGGRWWEQGGGHGQVGLKEAAVKQETDRQPWMGPSVIIRRSGCEQVRQSILVPGRAGS